VRALADSPHLGELRYLELAGVGLKDEGLRALAQSPRLGNLRRLDVSFNGKPGRAALREFADPASLPRLLSLATEHWHTRSPGVLADLGRAVAT
jgi:hypothetical protein